MPGLKQDADGHWNPDYAKCEECGGLYVSGDMHRKGYRHTEWLKGKLMGQEELELPQQPAPEGYRHMPIRLTFGATILCKKCKGKGKEKCPGCRGLGVVPNKGL